MSNPHTTPPSPESRDGDVLSSPDVDGTLDPDPADSTDDPTVSLAASDIARLVAGFESAIAPPMMLMPPEVRETPIVKAPDVATPPAPRQRTASPSPARRFEPLPPDAFTSASRPPARGRPPVPAGLVSVVPQSIVETPEAGPPRASDTEWLRVREHAVATKEARLLGVLALLALLASAVAATTLWLLASA